MSFESLGLDEALVRALTTAGYEKPTDVQAQAIPAALAGKDLRVCSNTGSGKTAAFVLPALMKVLAARKDPANKPKKGEVKGPRILVLVPTRELSMQVAKAASNYGRYVQWLSVTSVVGGVPYPAQLKALRGPLDILIATPGRLIDHIQSGKAVLENVEMLVLDEADRMLDMGFIEDIEHIAEQLPRHRQTLMASATFAGEVGRLAQRLQKEDVERIEIAAHTEKHENIAQQIMWADDLDHKHALLDHLLTEREVDQAVVFTSTQIDADRLADRLGEMGHSVAALHGGMPQGRRNRVLQGLRSRHLRILVATDVAARGIDVPTITHVINYGLPLKAEDYVHRIGRTGRAGRSGRAVTLAERRDVPMIKRIQHYTTQAIPVGTVAGLEPQRPAPDLVGRPPRGGAPRGQGGRNYGGQQGGGRFANDRPGHFGGRGSHGPHGHPGQGNRGPRRDDAFGQGPHERTNHERREASPWERRGEPRHDRRDDARFDPRFERSGEAPRFERRDERPAPGGRPFEHRGPRREGDGAAPRHHAGGPRPQADAGSSKPRWASKGSMPAGRPRKSM
ncbi:DEAD/DEAH box helicase [Ideonella sp. 4Y11]|uniref:DEAD/DEAH box helicase n=1 Tax=Ideonella aquatica TaxID=2824119 RepID=A0A941BEA7_9BURK|nr:DEAD/DEAH box helicase [Ideonella aquatica]MBQ0957521.1 DEAD/DEAH box helicase [Ideonella aquatica]